ncbi:chitin deacetylase [Nowakowskiella sp. JEL0407]|nr:chitin deacetylase [Nowakowskiella sp. JEL0407]
MRFSFEGLSSYEQDIHRHSYYIRKQLVDAPKKPSAFSPTPQTWETSTTEFRKLLFHYINGNKHPSERWHIHPMQIICRTDAYYSYDNHIKLERSGIGIDDESDYSVIADINEKVRFFKFEPYGGVVYRTDFDVISADGTVIPLRMYLGDGCADANTGLFGGVFHYETGQVIALIDGLAGDTVTKIWMLEDSKRIGYVPHGDVYTFEKTFHGEMSYEYDEPTDDTNLFEEIHERFKNGELVGKTVNPVRGEDIVKEGRDEFNLNGIHLTKTEFSTHMELERLFIIAANLTAPMLETPVAWTLAQSVKFRIEVVRFILEGYELNDDIYGCIAVYLPPYLYFTPKRDEKPNRYVETPKRDPSRFPPLPPQNYPTDFPFPDTFLLDPAVQSAITLVNSLVPAATLAIPRSTYAPSNTGIVAYAVGNAVSNCHYLSAGCVRPTDIFNCEGVGHWGITYDAGPTNLTMGIQDRLSQINASASFFVSGSNALKYPDIVTSHISRGHHIGLYPWTPYPLTTLSNEQIVAQIIYSEAALYQTIRKIPSYFRPPYGDCDDRVRAIVTALGYTVSLFTRDSQDSIVPKNDTGLTQINTNVESWMLDLGNSTSNFVSVQSDVDEFTAKSVIDWLTAVHEMSGLIQVGITSLWYCNPRTSRWIYEGSNTSLPNPVRH